MEKKAVKRNGKNILCTFRSTISFLTAFWKKKEKENHEQIKTKKGYFFPNVYQKNNRLTEKASQGGVGGVAGVPLGIVAW